MSGDETRSVYLAGPIQHAHDNGHGWRDYLIEQSDAFEWINPLDHAEPTDEEDESGDYDPAGLVATDKRLIDDCDAVLVGWQRIPSVGTPMEILYAFERGIPVVVWLEPEGSREAIDERHLSSWLRHHADHIDTGLESCLDALEELVARDRLREPTHLFDRRDRETFRQAVDVWGIEAQADMAEEECAEFIAASKHHRRYKVPVEDVIDELADIRIMSEQLTEFFGRDRIERHVRRKMDRLRQRLPAPEEEIVADGGDMQARDPRPDPEDDPTLCSLCGCYIGHFSGDYCEGCQRELGIKPPMRRCVHCGQRGPEEQMEAIDVSGPEEYYPTFEFLCRSCAGGDGR